MTHLSVTFGRHFLATHLHFSRPLYFWAVSSWHIWVSLAHFTFGRHFPATNLRFTRPLPFWAMSPDELSECHLPISLFGVIFWQCIWVSLTHFTFGLCLLIKSEYHLPSSLFGVICGKHIWMTLAHFYFLAIFANYESGCHLLIVLLEFLVIISYDKSEFHSPVSLLGVICLLHTWVSLAHCTSGW